MKRLSTADAANRGLTSAPRATVLHGPGPGFGQSGGYTHWQASSPPWIRSVLPFKHHAEHRHHIPKPRYRVTNWPEYDASLKRRGSLTVWFTDEAVAAWRAEPRTTPGGQPHCHVRFQGVRTQKSTRFFSSRLVSLMLACTVGGEH
jgi:hypothetical protein